LIKKDQGAGIKEQRSEICRDLIAQLKSAVDFVSTYDSDQNFGRSNFETVDLDKDRCLDMIAKVFDQKN